MPDDLKELVQLLGLRIKKARIMAQRRQQDLARAAGISCETLSRIERGQGEGVSLKIWYRLSKVLGLEDTWEGVMEVAQDPFEEYDRKLLEREQIKKKRVRFLSPSPPKGQAR